MAYNIYNMDYLVKRISQTFLLENIMQPRYNMEFIGKLFTMYI